MMGLRVTVRLSVAARCLICLACLIVAADALADRTNVLLICVDDLRPELGCYGRSYVHSPNIDQLAAHSRIFAHHYVQAPTCGASRYTLLTGQYGPADNGALFQRAARMQRAADAVNPSMPAWFRQHGYQTVSVGKVSHHPGGRGGSDWDDDGQPEMPESWDRHLLPSGDWQHPRGAMHGLAHGEIRTNVGKMDVFQSVEGSDSIYPDGLIIEESLRQLDELSRHDQPFFLAVGIIRPHLPFGAPARYMEPYRDVVLPPIPHPVRPSGKTTWHGSGEFMKYNRWNRNPDFATEVRRHYAACVTYADSLVGRLLKRLDETGQRERTIVVLWGDHGWHLGEHQIWGKHSLFEESLRSPLLIQAPGIADPGKTTAAVVETLDLFPTLCELSGLQVPAFAQGVSLAPILADPSAAGHDAVSYKGDAKTIRTATHRLIVHRGGEVELYDHTAAAGETKNIAEQHPEMVRELKARLAARLP
jgi:iduronate 2-sulfatase